MKAKLFILRAMLATASLAANAVDFRMGIRNLTEEPIIFDANTELYGHWSKDATDAVNRKILYDSYDLSLQSDKLPSSESNIYTFSYWIPTRITSVSRTYARLNCSVFAYYRDLSSIRCGWQQNNPNQLMWYIRANGDKIPKSLDNRMLSETAVPSAESLGFDLEFSRKLINGVFITYIRKCKSSLCSDYQDSQTYTVDNRTRGEEIVCRSSEGYKACYNRMIKCDGYPSCNKSPFEKNKSILVKKQ